MSRRIFVRQGLHWGTIALIAIAAATVVLRGLSTYHNFVAGTIAVAAVAAIGLNLLVGNAGLISLATPAFMAVGAYGAGIMLQHTPLTLAGAIIVPVVGAVIAGGLLGLLALRLRGFYLGLATLGLLEATQYVLVQGGTLVGSGYGFAMPAAKVGKILTVTDWSAIAMAVAVFVAAGVWSLRRSAVGRALTLMRQHEVVAGCTGMNVIRLKVGAFAVSAGLGALAGVLSGFVQGAVSPNQFDLTLSVSQLAFIVFGGLGSVAGAAVGTTVLMLLPELFRSVGQNEGILYAAVLLAVVIVAPKGMVPTAAQGIYRILPGGRASLRRWRSLVRRAGEPADIGFAKEALTARSAGATAATLERSGSLAVPPVLIFEGIGVSYGGVRAVKGFSASVTPGTVHGLIGPNGAGKSSAVAALFGLVRVTDGSIRVGASELQSRARHSQPWQVAAHGIGRTFQTPVAGTGLTTLESIQNGCYPTMRTGFLRTGARTPSVVADEWRSRDIAGRCLELVRFPSDFEKPVAELTLGELRRLELARVLAADPAVIVLDEPTSGLELADADALFVLLGDLAHDQNRTILIVEHNVQLIFGHCDSVTVMSLGEVIASGAPESIAGDLAVKEAYLGVR